MPWVIEATVGRQETPDGPDVDAELWRFQVTRGTEERHVEVLITTQALYTDVPAIRRAVDTSGHSALGDVLDELGDGEPPSRITITKDEIDY